MSSSTVDKGFLNELESAASQVKNDIGMTTIGDDYDFSKTDVVYEDDSRINKFYYKLQIIFSDFKVFVPALLIIALYVLTYVESFSSTRQLIEAYRNLSLKGVDVESLRYFFFLVAPMCVWLIQTNIEQLNFNYMKYGLFLVNISLIILKFASFAYTIVYRFIIPDLVYWVPMIAEKEGRDDVTSSMIISFGYLSLLIGTMLVVAFAIWIADSMIREVWTFKEISDFKLRHAIQFDYAPYKYNIKIVRDNNTGIRFKINEKDRYLHTNVAGSTGTGKTSMIYLVMIFIDLLQRKKNEKKAKKIIIKMIENKQLYINMPFEDKSFCYEYFTPNPGYEKKFEKIKHKYRLMGVTFVAPDNDSTDLVCKMAELLKMDYSRIDPQPNDDGTYKNNTRGFNILKLPKKIADWALPIAIAKKATLLADVMQMNFEQSGKSDPYFSSVNRIATTTLAFLLMLTYDRVHKNGSPHIGLVQDLLNDFTKIEKYHRELRNIIKETGKYHALSDVITTYFVNNLKFKEHCSGLIAQFNNLLMNDLLREILCTTHSVDLDEALATSKITVVNTGLGPLGKVNSTSFGQFFMNSLVDSVTRRPGNEDTRSPHALFIDEFPLIVNEELEQMFTLFRKYRVMAHVAVQNLAQFKNNMEYLKNVVISNCGHHFVFGRAAREDMEIYSDIAGHTMTEIVQKTISNSPMFNESGSSSTSYRTTPNLELNQEKADIRFKDFKELLLLTTKGNRPLPGRVVRSNFNKRSAYMKRPVYYVNWSEYYDKQSINGLSVDDIKSKSDEAILGSGSGSMSSLKVSSKTTVRNVPNEDSLVHAGKTHVVSDEQKNVVEKESSDPSSSSDSFAKEDESVVKFSDLINSINKGDGDDI